MFASPDLLRRPVIIVQRTARCDNIFSRSMTSNSRPKFTSKKIINHYCYYIIFTFSSYGTNTKSIGVRKKSKTWTATKATQSTIIVFWKATAFPCLKAVDRHWNTDVFLVIVVMHQLDGHAITCARCLYGNWTEDVCAGQFCVLRPVLCELLYEHLQGAACQHWQWIKGAGGGPK